MIGFPKLTLFVCACFCSLVMSQSHLLHVWNIFTGETWPHLRGNGFGK